MRSEKGTICIVDDDDEVRALLNMMLTAEGYEVREYAAALEYLSSKKPESSPACLLLDVSMPGLDGLELQSTLNQLAGRNIPIVFISGQTDIQTGVQAMKGGAVDFLPKPLNKADVLKCVETALLKDKRLYQSEEKKRALVSRYDTLTHREKEVFALVVEGLLNKQIGAELGIKEKTIKVHRGKVMAKMQADSLAELVKFSAILDLPSPVKDPRK